jgi:hypothetical protein
MGALDACGVDTGRGRIGIRDFARDRRGSRFGPGARATGASSVTTGSAEASDGPAGSDAIAGGGVVIRDFARDCRGSRFGTGAWTTGASFVVNGSAETCDDSAGSDAVAGGGAAGGGAGDGAMLCSIESSLRVSRSIALTASHEDSAATSTVGLISSGGPAANI